MEAIIRDIRRKCRLAMNGVASTSMRKQGLNYKLNFGVSIGKIKEIAASYSKDKNLAEALWKEDTRELKILATMLYPTDQFDRESALRWIQEIPNQEIREQLGFNIFRHIPEALEIGLNCANEPTPMVRASGYWFAGKQIGLDKSISIEQFAFLPYIWEDIISDDVSLRNAAKFFLVNTGKSSEKMADYILSKTEIYRNSTEIIQKETYESLRFEFDFFYNRLDS